LQIVPNRKELLTQTIHDGELNNAASEKDAISKQDASKISAQRYGVENEDDYESDEGAGLHDAKVALKQEIRIPGPERNSIQNVYDGLGKHHGEDKEEQIARHTSRARKVPESYSVDLKNDKATDQKAGELCRPVDAFIHSGQIMVGKKANQFIQEDKYDVGVKERVPRQHSRSKAPKQQGPFQPDHGKPNHLCQHGALHQVT
jgi:hypothetical protein